MKPQTAEDKLLVSVVAQRLRKKPITPQERQSVNALDRLFKTRQISSEEYRRAVYNLLIYQGEQK